ncbi:MAG TPA: histidine kinase [Thermoanaerobaculia bacterium]|nr:histidine kinase [Thermoanaerobaculia bacterium]
MGNVLLLLVFAATPYVFVENVRMHIGDDPRWAAPSFDDSTWTMTRLDEVPETNDVVWLRAKIDLSNLQPSGATGSQPVGNIRLQKLTPLAIYFAGLASHELFWDGERIGGGGVVARTKQREQPGPIEAHYQIPDRLASPTVHTIAIRASAFHRGFVPRNGYWSLIAGDYDRVAAMRTTSAHRATIALSGILLTAVFAFAMFWLARRDFSFLLLGTLCLSAAALLIAEAWRELFGYTYDWHLVRLVCIVALSWLVGVQLVALLIARFPHRYGRAVLAATAIYATIVPFLSQAWDPKSLNIFLGCCSVAAAWAAFATYRRMHGSTLALIGTGALVLPLFLQPYSWVDNVLYFALNFLFLCLLCSHALEVRREQQERARLQLEVLRRHMQPHFLMNTLTALSEWIEQEPQTAVRMIESLSEELRILGEMSTKTLVPVDEELRLCRSHLANMSLRKDVAYSLEVDGIDGARLIPPAIFHTLIENAITHGSSAPQVTMRLSYVNKTYIFEAPVAPPRNSEELVGSGTRYIEARLREAFGAAWSFRQGRAGDVWRVEIAT